MQLSLIFNGKNPYTEIYDLHGTSTSNQCTGRTHQTYIYTPRQKCIRHILWSYNDTYQKYAHQIHHTLTTRTSYCQCLVTLAMVEGSYHLSWSRGSSLVSVGTTSLECSILKCGQATQRTIHLTTLQDATFQTGSTHADKTAPPAPWEMVWPLYDD
jgi:hypothetical protein